MILAFNISNVLIGGAFVGVLGLVLGVALGIIGKVFFVKVDEREIQVRECLPGNNCGGCGYAGCDGLAAAIAKGEAPVNGCPVSNAEAKAKIGEIMGQSVGADDKKVAFVKCSGTCDKTERKYNYYGVNDCRKAMIAPGSGDKLCSYGCMGFEEGCKFRVGVNICRRDIPIMEVRRLLAEGATATMGGFISKNGKYFEARLVLKDGNAFFEFTKG